MIILIGCKINKEEILVSLGKPEYSYFFLMKSFVPALQRLGQVVSVENVDEVDEKYLNYKSAGHEVVFLSFSPPHQTPVDLKCPTVNIFAWEFNSIPTKESISHVPLPADSWGEARYDWQNVFKRIAGVISTSQEAANLVRLITDRPVMAIPSPVWGRYTDDESVHPGLGGRSLKVPVHVLDSRTLGLDAERLIRPKESEALRITRAMWRGWWHEVRLPLLASCEVDKPTSKPSALELEGVVYTSVLNPSDGRKNWVEMVTAFCWAFRDKKDATLILKMTHHDIDQYRDTFFNQLSRLMPFSCRIVVLHGFLDDEQYHQLIRVTNYYVNASSGEGLCLPLMEFLCSGRPAVAPRHTAMGDYLRSEYCFAVTTSLEPDCWPCDPFGRLITHSHRLNWQSLVEAFSGSYIQAQNREDYIASSEAAKRFMKDFCSPEVVAVQLQELFRRSLRSDLDECSA